MYCLDVIRDRNSKATRRTTDKQTYRRLMRDEIRHRAQIREIALRANSRNKTK